MTDDNDVKDPAGLLAAYNKAKDDLVTLRAENKALQGQVDATSEDAVKKWRERAIRSEARATLEGQGIKNAERVVKYLDLEGVDYDDKDQLTGLDAKVEVIKGDFPELFDTKKRAGKNSADIHGGEPVKKEMSDTEQQVARLFGH